jgi:hypothetical protein
MMATHSSLHFYRSSRCKYSLRCSARHQDKMADTLPRRQVLKELWDTCKAQDDQKQTLIKVRPTALNDGIF